MNIVQLLKYIDIAYPPNVLKIFRQDDQSLLFKDDIIYDNKNLPNSFVIFNVSASLINNLFDDFIIMWIFISISIMIAFLLKYQHSVKKFKPLNHLFMSLKSMFSWSTLIMLFLTKYLRFSVFLLLFLHYHNDLLQPLNFILSYLCDFLPFTYQHSHQKNLLLFFRESYSNRSLIEEFTSIWQKSNNSCIQRI